MIPSICLSYCKRDDLCTCVYAIPEARRVTAIKVWILMFLIIVLRFSLSVWFVGGFNKRSIPG